MVFLLLVASSRFQIVATICAVLISRESRVIGGDLASHFVHVVTYDRASTYVILFRCISCLSTLMTSFDEKRKSWLETDEREEAIAALEFLVELASALPSNIYRWKWVIIVTHSAV